MGFDRTYEGLKPRHAEAVGLGAVARFDRTYEGLKQLTPEDAAAYILGFDRTYEGLKQEPHHLLAKPRARVLTVPMRV